MKRRYNLVNALLESSDFVILDTSAEINAGGDWYANGVYEAKTYSEVDTKKLRRAKVELKRFNSVLKRRNVHTAPGVAEEIQRICERLKGDIRFMDNKVEIAKRYPKERRNKGEDLDEESRLLGSELINSLCFLYDQTYREANNSRVKFAKDPNYKDLVEIAKIVSDVSRAKKNYNHRHNVFSHSGEDLHTDENSIAASIYLSAFEDTETDIITRDSDFNRIARNVLAYLSREHRKGGWILYEATTQTPFRIHYLENPFESGVVLDSKEFDPDDTLEHRIRSRSRIEINRRLNEEVYHRPANLA